MGKNIFMIGNTRKPKSVSDGAKSVTFYGVLAIRGEQKITGPRMISYKK